MNISHPNESIAVPVGAVAPDFALANSDGRIYQLATATTAALLIFYRGDW